MKKSKKTIISCAITGSIHTPSMSPYLPITPDEIAREAIAAAEAGAAILHLHARDPDNGKPTQNPEIFKQILPRIKEQSDAIINITTGGGMGMHMDERLAAAKWAQPELASLNMGSMNFGAFRAADARTDWKYDWEESYLRNSKDAIYSNTFKQIETIIQTLSTSYGTRFEFECYDVGHLYTLAYFANQQLIKPPFFIQFVCGVLGGIGPEIENITHMVRIADNLFGDDYCLSVFGAGRHQMPLTTLSALMGGNVRVGLEDNLYLAKNKLAKSNAEQVTLIKRILSDLSKEIATPAEARDMLGLKGMTQVNF
ncbi:MAG: 3-keto-5-aminohexanoate cleavage protein [Alphaproteobacteria bacterium]|nr:MAG: 3-keto-5-aminohexanoate cleavage protein [Alphaproteobacteria bacterium]